MPKYCKYCGCELPQDARFCPYCGKPLTDDTAPLFVVEEPEKPDSPKKKRSWSIPIILLIIAIIAAGLIVTYNHFSSHSNALIPKDTVDKDSVVYNFDENGENPIDDAEDSEAALRRRVQAIYTDVLKMNPNANYTGRYCTSNFNALTREASNVDMTYIDFNYWVFEQEYDKPSIEQMKIISFKDETAVVKVAIRPVYGGQVIKIVTLKMLIEDGVWLIDDFQCDGISVKTKARRAIEEAQIRQEIQEYEEEEDFFEPQQETGFEQAVYDNKNQKQSQKKRKS